jgi:hypothetical protein
MAAASSPIPHDHMQRRRADEARCPSDLFNAIELEALLARIESPPDHSTHTSGFRSLISADEAGA